MELEISALNYSIQTWYLNENKGTIISVRANSSPGLLSSKYDKGPGDEVQVQAVASVQVVLSKMSCFMVRMFDFVSNSVRCFS